MSTVLLTLAAEGPQWPQILGVLVAVWLVFWWAVWARRPAAVPGRHRPDQVGVPDVFDRVMAAAAPVEAAAAFRAAHRVVAEQLAAEVRVPAHLLAVDDWTADLPTKQLPVIVEEPVEQPQHTSPTQRARERWQVDCPIFAVLAEEWKFEDRDLTVTPPLASAA